MIRNACGPGRSVSGHVIALGITAYDWALARTARKESNVSDSLVLMSSISHRSKAGETFVIEVRKKQLTDVHTYWLYFVDAKHEKWGVQRFHIFVTKQSFPTEGMADHLAMTLGLDAAKGELEEATEQGRPLRWPVMWEGWGMM